MKGEIFVAGSLKPENPRKRDVWFILQDILRIFKVVLKGSKSWLIILGLDSLLIQKST